MFNKVMYNSITFQYVQKFVGEIDWPWSKAQGNIQRRDYFYLTLNGLPASFDSEEKCFNLMVGVLPSPFAASEFAPDYTSCASEQQN